MLEIVDDRSSSPRVYPRFATMSIEINDDEWRWADLPAPTQNNPTPNIFADETGFKDIHNHYFSTSLLSGGFEVKARKQGTGIGGPNSLNGLVYGAFQDWYMHWRGVVYPDIFMAQQSRNLSFACNSQSGHITTVAGLVAPGGGSVNKELAVRLTESDPQVDETGTSSHFVQVKFVGDVGVAGSFTVTTTGGGSPPGPFDFTVEYSETKTYGKNLGEWVYIAQLDCVKGSVP